MSFSSKFVKQIEASKQQNIYLIHGEDNGLECWHYVLVENLKLPLLLAKIRQLPCNLDVTDYGKLLVSGWGEQPSQEIRNKIEAGDYDFPQQEYGFEIFHIKNHNEAGEEFFAFVAVPNKLADKFNYLMNKQGSNVNLHDWGNVLKWGWGQASAEDVEFFSNFLKTEPA